MSVLSGNYTVCPQITYSSNFILYLAPLPGSRLPFRLSPPLPAYPSENHAAGNYLKMPSRRSPQKRNILRSFQSRTRQYRGRGEEKEEGYDAEKLARKKGISSSFFFLKKRTDQLLPFVLVPQP